MARYIDADIAHDNLQNASISTRFVDDVPTADVAPVVRGEWVDGDCSICNYGYLDYTDADAYIRDLTHPKFCGGCGARMDGGTE